MSEYKPGDELPDRRRHGYKELDQKLEAHTATIEQRFSEWETKLNLLAKSTQALAASTQERFRRWFIVGLLAFSVIGLASGVAIIGYGFVIKNQRKTAARTAQRIQDQREATVRGNCETTNTRNRRTSEKLIAASKLDLSTAKTAAQRSDIRRRRDFTLALIDALVPIEDCDQKVKDAVKGN